MSKIEFTAFVRSSAGKSPFFVPKKLAFNQFFGNCGTVHFDIWFSASTAFLMDKLRDKLFAGSVFAGNQDGSIGWRRFFNLFFEPFDC